jgi:hypothetical protein
MAPSVGQSVVNVPLFVGDSPTTYPYLLRRYAEDFVQPLDDVGSFDRGELEAAACVGAERLGREGALESLDLILGQHFFASCV